MTTTAPAPTHRHGPLFHRVDGPHAVAELVAGSDTDVLAKLDGKPALLHLPGAHEGMPARLVVTLLHGNEDSGFRAVCRWLRTHPTPRQPLWIFFGNVRAATQNGWFADRYLDDQEDFNRVWDIHPATTRMRLCAAEVLATVTAGPLEAAIDIHNNTGDNPLYAIVPTHDDPRATALAGTLADIGLLWGTQQHTLMQVLGRTCPTVAVECGRAGVPANVDVAERVLRRFLDARHFDGRPAQMLEVAHRVEVRPEVTFAFADDLPDDLDLVITPGLDDHNFDKMRAGTILGRTIPGGDIPFEALDADGRESTADLLHVDDDGVITLVRDVIPAMMTRTPEQTRRDCLFYVLQRV